jgi:enolase
VAPITITGIHGREILDSRGNPTVEVDIRAGAQAGRAAVPSGASTGEREALELRDGDKTRYLGKGVRNAVAHVNGEIAQAVVGKSFDQRELDRVLVTLDGTPSKSRLGANATLGVSMAMARAAAAAAGVPLYAHFAALAGRATGDAPYLLPVPMMNILNGGAHADSSVDLQEFMVMPVGMPTFAEALRAGAEIFHALRAILKKGGYATGVGDEGGFAPSLKSNVQALDLVLEAVGAAGLKAGSDVHLALDVAASEFWDSGKYVFKKSGEPTRTPDQMVEMYVSWVKQYPIISIETAWPRATGTAGRRSPPPSAIACSSSGDDVFVTNPEILSAGICRRRGQRAARQAQSDRHRVSETLDAIAMAEAPSYATVISHRSGETEDSTIATSRWDVGRPDQDRLGEPERPRRQVQPAAAHRGGAGGRRPVCRPRRDPSAARPKLDVASADTRGNGERRCSHRAGARVAGLGAACHRVLQR